MLRISTASLYPLSARLKLRKTQSLFGTEAAASAKKSFIFASLPNGRQTCHNES